MKDSGTIGLRLAQLRGSKSDQQVAEEMHAKGIAKEYTTSSLRKLLNEWESDKRTPKIINIIDLADFYQVTTDYLLGRQENEYNYDSIEALADVLNLDRSAAENLLKLSITEGGIVSFTILGGLLKSSLFNSVMMDLKKSEDGISRQIRYCEKEVPDSFKEQCKDMADMYLVKAHEAIDILLKDVLGYNDLMHIINPKE